MKSEESIYWREGLNSLNGYQYNMDVSISTLMRYKELLSDIVKKVKKNIIYK